MYLLEISSPRQQLVKWTKTPGELEAFCLSLIDWPNLCSICVIHPETAKSQRLLSIPLPLTSEADLRFHVLTVFSRLEKYPTFSLN
jgi:hypothetical protein